MLKLFKKKEKYRFYHDEYKVWIILTKLTKHKLHDWENWGKCFHILDSVIKKYSDIMSVRTSQSVPKSSRWLSFGRMTWNEKNNIKWTSKYKTGDDKKEHLEFFDTEFWSPSWTICDKEKLSPKIFMKVSSAENGVLNGLFTESLVIGVKKDDQIMPDNVIDSLYNELKAEYLISGIRPWGKTISEDSWFDSLMDFSPYQIVNKENNKYLELKSSSDLLGDWKIEKTFGDNMYMS